MIDYVKVQLIVNPPALIQTLFANGFEVGGNYDYETGEALPYPIKAWNETLEVIFKSPNFIQLSGSIHKHAHGSRNHTDFSFTDVIETILKLIDDLELNPHTSALHCIEVGVNINPPFETKAFLKNVLNYCGTPFTPMRSRTGVSLGVECQLTQFRIKMYCKKSQYHLPQETMRFEIHVDRMQYLTEKKISTRFLTDFFILENFILMGKLLNKVYNEIVIMDKSIPKERLSKSELKVYNTWINPNAVEELYSNDIKKFQYQRRQWRIIQKQYSTLHHQQKIADLIDDKVFQLLITDEKTSTILTDFNNRYVNTNFNHSLPSDKRAVSLKTFSPFINDSSSKYVQQDLSKTEFDKAAEQVGNIGETKNDPILSIDELRKQGKLIETSFKGTDGKFYVPNPIDPKRIAVYESPEAYNKRLHYPIYIDKEEAEKLFLEPLPINWETLQTVNPKKK